MPAQIVYDVSIQYIYGRIMCTSIYNANMGVSWYYMCTSSVLYS